MSSLRDNSLEIAKTFIAWRATLKRERGEKKWSGVRRNGRSRIRKRMQENRTVVIVLVGGGVKKRKQENEIRKQRER